MIGWRRSPIKPPARDRLRTSPWVAALWAVVLLGLLGLVVVTWVQDNPDVPLEERTDLFMLLVIVVAVAAYTLDHPDGSWPEVGRRPWLRWPLIGSLVGRRKRAGPASRRKDCKGGTWRAM